MLEKYIYFPYADKWTLVCLHRDENGHVISWPFPNTNKRTIVVKTKEDAIRTCRALALLGDSKYERG